MDDMNFNQPETLIVVIVPMVIALMKMILPKIPKWALPILAPVLGCAGEHVVNLGTGNAVGPLMGAILGSAGVGLREIAKQTKEEVKQIKKKRKQTKDKNAG